jgi:4-amino-4-deoxy-L-arabinose transferase-like glycosyltransferase
VWLKLDTYPLIWDSSAHFLESLQIYDILHKLSINSFWKIISVSREEYPYFISLVTALFYNLFGRSEDAGVFINGSLFLAILIFSVFGITKKIDSKNSGLFAAFLVTTYPIIFGHSRVFMYDLPLIAMVCLSVYTFLLTDNLKKRSCSLLFGVTMGLGMLTKIAFPFFIFSALFYYIYKGFLNVAFDIKKKTKAHSRQAMNFMVALSIGIILASTWYIPNFSHLVKSLIALPAYGEVHPPVFSTDSLFYYLFKLINYHISFFGFLVFIISFIFFIKAKIKNKLFLIYWILIPYVIFSLIYYKSVRYILPYLPPIAIISSIGILNIQHRKLRSLAITIIILVSLLQFFSYSFGIKFLPSTLTTTVAGKVIFLFNQEGNENAMEQHRAPLKQDWKTAETLNTISKFLVEANAQSLNVFIIPDDPRIHSPLISLAYLKRKPIYFAVGSWENIANSKADLVITKDGNWMVPPYFMEKINQSVKWFDENIGKFTLIKKINLPDNSNLLIYKQN